MHFEILVEDRSSGRFLEVVVPRIIGDEHTCRVIPYKGIGRIPAGLSERADASKRILLAQLPKLLRGYGRTFSNYPANYRAVVIVVCDLDDRCRKTFREELMAVLAACDPPPATQFCIAVEEGEAWLLGDLVAVKQAYPRARDAILGAYVPDSICGTWERLADALYPGGSDALVANGWQAVGAEKFAWSDRIAPRMDLDRNQSPSFSYFRDKLRRLVND